MTSKFSDDEQPHYEGDRDLWEDYDDEPTFEKWRKGGKWN
jgi:hypothetical protein